MILRKVPIPESAMLHSALFGGGGNPVGCGKLLLVLLCVYICEHLAMRVHGVRPAHVADPAFHYGGLTVSS